MKNIDMQKMILTAYGLTMLFLCVVYMQDSFMSEPGAMATINNAAQSFSGNNTQYGTPLLNIQIAESSIITLFIGITMLFGLAWRSLRSRSSEY